MEHFCLFAIHSRTDSLFRKYDWIEWMSYYYFYNSCYALIWYWNIRLFAEYEYKVKQILVIFFGLCA